MNAFFSHGEAEYFLARRGERVVGRISAQINHAFNDQAQKSTGVGLASWSWRTIKRRPRACWTPRRRG